MVDTTCKPRSLRVIVTCGPSNSCTVGNVSLQDSELQDTDSHGDTLNLCTHDTESNVSGVAV